MSHMVIYRGTDGKPGYHQTDDIHDAVTFVEQLRNDNGVEHARIFRLEEVNFEYRPYFRVELKAGDPALASAPITPAVEASPPPAAVPAKTTTPSDTASSATEETMAPASASTAPSTPDTSAASDVASTATETKADSAKPADASSPSGSDKSDTDNGVGARRGLFGR